MMLLWTSSPLPASKVIRWGLDSNSSHFSTAYFDQGGKGIVVHQEFKGFEIDWMPDFLNKRKVVNCLYPKKTDLDLEEQIMTAIMDKYSDTLYDHPAFIYFSWRVLLKKALGLPIPSSNAFSSDRLPLCTGHAEVIESIKPDWFSEPVKDFDMISPQALFNLMLDSGKFHDLSSHY